MKQSNLIQDRKTNLIKRDMKIDDEVKNNSPLKDFREVEDFLKSVTKKFTKEPITLENLEKAYTDVVGKAKTTDNIDPKLEKGKKSKKAEEKSIFHDIFIKPKENKIKEIRKKQSENKEMQTLLKKGNTKEKKNDFLIDTNNKGPSFFVSNKIETIDKTFSSPQNKNINFKNQPTSNVKINSNDKTQIISNLEGNPDISLLKYLSEKFLPNEDQKESKKNFFNQLIQIKPPEGINAVVASPLMDSKGWAPSIPSVQVNKHNTNLQDLLMRAKGGIQAGDIPKEAHMAFYLGVLNEEEKNYDEALKFYKKYFLSAKLLQDIYGTELALNRIAVLYSNIYDYEQSLYYNEKHKEITTNNINGFVASYNSGVDLRILGRYEDSIKNFEKALTMASEENDLESYCICLCQISISSIFLGNYTTFFELSDEFFTKNKTLKNADMEMEMLMLTGYMNNTQGSNDISKEYYFRALKQSTMNKNTFYKEVSLCNIGLIDCYKNLDDYLEGLNNDS